MEQKACVKLFSAKHNGAKHSPLSLEVMVALRARFSCLKISNNFHNVLSNQIEFDSILKQFGKIAFRYAS